MDWEVPSPPRSPASGAHSTIVNPAVLAGKPVVRRTRISIELVIERLADGWSEDTILDQYPSLSRDDIRACSITLRE